MRMNAKRWMDKYGGLTSNDGWSLVDDKGVAKIVHDKKMNLFMNETALFHYLKARAVRGSTLAIAALIFNGRPVDETVHIP